jgi:hypothetical protein
MYVERLARRQSPAGEMLLDAAPTAIGLARDPVNSARKSLLL